MKNIRESLQGLQETTDSELTKAVIDDILENEGEEASYMKDVLSHGCISGVVGGLIYYTDTHAFYDKHYDDIEAMRSEMLEHDIDVVESIGDNDLKNHLAWFGYEETVRKIADKIGFDI